jgi:hypothetical protein
MAIKVYSLEEAVSKVRERYPTATAEGSTFDWCFFVGDLIVAEMKTNRRSREASWKLDIYPIPKGKT